MSYSFREVHSVGDLHDLKDMTFRDLWYHFYRIYRVIQKNEVGTSLGLAARAVFPPSSIEGYWYRMLAGANGDPYIVPVFIRLFGYKNKKKRGLIKCPKK